MFNKLAAYKVDENLYAGEKPYSLFEQDEMIEELKSYGIDTIISLMEKDESQYDISELENEFKLFNFPILDNSVPSMKTINEILSHIDNNNTTYLHCNLGLGRTGILVASYLHQTYGYESVDIIDKIDELKKNTRLFKYSSPITKQQIDFVKIQLISNRERYLHSGMSEEEIIQTFINKLYNKNKT